MYHHFLLQISPDEVRRIVQEAVNRNNRLTPGQEQILTAGVFSYIFAGVVQWAKWSKLKSMNWINENTPWVTRTVVALLSAGTAIGIHLAWNWNSDAGVFSWTVSGLTVPNLMSGLKHVIFNYAQQHGWWKILYAGQEPARVIKTPAA